MTTSDKLLKLRDSLRENGVHFLIVPSSDPHLSEYVADHWKAREWITGFSGSAGTAVIGWHDAGLWTDSRYFLQAEEQIAGSGISLFKEGMRNTPAITEWICANAQTGNCIGIDGSRFAANEVEELQQLFSSKGLTLKTDACFIDNLWADIPLLPQSELFAFDESYCGESCSKKLERVREYLSANHANALLISALDEIAWLFNIRASDVEFNPVPIAFAIVYENAATLFTESSRITDKTKLYLAEAGVETLDYSYIYKVLESLAKETKILADKKRTNYALLNSIPTESLIVGSSPITAMKSIKNETEIAGIHNAAIKDGIALCYAFRWLEEEIANGSCVTELSFADRLRSFRSEQSNFFGESFGTIAGYGSHGAIVHYSATPESNIEIGRNELFLVDSGGNYFDGTTDITRTVILGTPSPLQIEDYTNVLKGHIALATIHFPEGTHGVQLDVLARQYLWNAHENYGHGTGHGIGHFLCVHEGPQNIRTRDNGTPLQAGMLISNEPGIYRTGQHGIRIENMVLVQKSAETEFGQFLHFETISLFPFEQKLINKAMLNEKERAWINEYHQKVYALLAPLLDSTTQKWLLEKVKII